MKQRDGGGRGRRAGCADQDGGDGAAVNRAEGDGQQHGNTGRGVHAIGKGQQQRPRLFERLVEQQGHHHKHDPDAVQHEAKNFQQNKIGHGGDNADQQLLAEQLRLFTATLAELLDDQKDAAHGQAHTNGLGESAGADLRLTRQHLEGIGVKEEKCGNRYQNHGEYNIQLFHKFSFRVWAVHTPVRTAHLSRLRRSVRRIQISVDDLLKVAGHAVQNVVTITFSLTAAFPGKPPFMLALQLDS